MKVGFQVMLASLPKRGIQFLIAIVMEISNLSMVAYSHNEKMLTFTYLLTQPVSADEIDHFRKSVFNHLNVLAKLNQEYIVEDQFLLESRFLTYYDPISQVSVLNYNVPGSSFHIQALRIISKLASEQIQTDLIRDDAHEEKSVTQISDDLINQGIRAENAFPSESPSKVYREGTRIFVAY